MADAVLILDLRDHVVNLNQAAQMLFEIIPGNIIGFHVRNLIPQFDEFKEEFYNTNQLSVEYVHDTAHNNRYFELTRSATDKTSTGSPGSTIVIRDITNAKQTERTLLKSHKQLEEAVSDRTRELEAAKTRLENTVKELENTQKTLYDAKEKFTKIFRHTPTLIAVFRTFDRELVDANFSIESFTGYERDECVGKKLDEFGCFEDPAYVIREIDRIKTEGSSTDIKFRIRTKTGDLKTLISSGELITVGGDEYTLTFTEDITELEKTISALKESNKRLSFTMEATNTGLWDWEISTGKIQFSPEFYLMLGYEPYRFPQTYESWKSLLHHRDVKSTLAKIQDHFQGKTPIYNDEFRLRAQNGEWRWIHSRGVILDRDDTGSPLRMLGTHIDITDTKQAQIEKAELEKKVLQSQKFEAIATLAGGIAHDFNNILGVIMGNAELALESEDFQDEDSREGINLILKSAQRGQDLVNQILTFSRIDETEKQVVDLNIIAQETIKMLRSLIPTTIKIIWEMPDQPSYIRANPAKIQQIFINICNNAAHAMKVPGGELHITLKQVMHDLPAMESEMFCLIQIADTGEGMSQAVKDRIFEPFFTTKKPNEGTGLGLSVVHGTVTDHNGAIHVESTRGQGTKFSIYLPMIEDRVGDIPDGESPLLHRGSEKILLVDDNENMGRTMGRILTKLGHQYDIFTNSVEAFETFRDNPGLFDLVITDIVMPDLTGDELARRVRSICPDIPIIIYSGSSPQENLQNFATENKIQFVQKPISIKSISRLIKELIVDRDSTTFIH